jgi:hypothetical protein
VDKQDIAFFQILTKEFPKINLIYQPDGVVNGIHSINAFYRQCVEKDAIYFRLDDDIVWMEPDMIEKMVRFRIDNPEYFLYRRWLLTVRFAHTLCKLRVKLN